MGGINLSQSLQAKQAEAKGRMFDQGFFLTLGGLVLLLAVFGGTRFYVSSLEKKMIALDQVVAEKTASLRGREVDRIVDFSRREEAIQKHLATEPDPVAALRELEMYTLPSIRLTGYDYDRASRLTLLSGSSDTLKEVAQQMLAFKNLKNTEKITVENIDYDEDGNVLFTFNVHQSEQSLPDGGASLPQ